eukprot:Rhum_TRINITY_DN10960_c0_g1::Rhum_TRINITY_DN10960_c0_g1_i1::g.41540::m.41540
MKTTPQRWCASIYIVNLNKPLPRASKINKSIVLHGAGETGGEGGGGVGGEGVERECLQSESAVGGWGSGGGDAAKAAASRHLRLLPDGGKRSLRVRELPVPHRLGVSCLLQDLQRQVHVLQRRAPPLQLHEHLRRHVAVLRHRLCNRGHRVRPVHPNRVQHHAPQQPQHPPLLALPERQRQTLRRHRHQHLVRRVQGGRAAAAQPRLHAAPVAPAQVLRHRLPPLLRRRLRLRHPRRLNGVARRPGDVQVLRARPARGAGADGHRHARGLLAAVGDADDRRVQRGVGVLEGGRGRVPRVRLRTVGHEGSRAVRRPAAGARGAAALEEVGAAETRAALHPRLVRHAVVDADCVALLDVACGDDAEQRLAVVARLVQDDRRRVRVARVLHQRRKGEDGQPSVPRTPHGDGVALHREEEAHRLVDRQLLLVQRKVLDRLQEGGRQLQVLLGGRLVRLLHGAAQVEHLPARRAVAPLRCLEELHEHRQHAVLEGHTRHLDGTEVEALFRLLPRLQRPRHQHCARLQLLRLDVVRRERLARPRRRREACHALREAGRHEAGRELRRHVEARRVVEEHVAPRHVAGGQQHAAAPRRLERRHRQIRRPLPARKQPPGVRPRDAACVTADGSTLGGACGSGGSGRVALVVAVHSFIVDAVACDAGGSGGTAAVRRRPSRRPSTVAHAGQALSLLLQSEAFLLEACQGVGAVAVCGSPLSLDAREALRLLCAQLAKVREVELRPRHGWGGGGTCVWRGKGVRGGEVRGGRSLALTLDLYVFFLPVSMKYRYCSFY